MLDRIIIAVDNPTRPDVLRLLQAHLDFAHSVTPAGHVHALDVDGLLDPAVTFFSARADHELFGVGALRQLDEVHVEVKSMHTTAPARGKGIGRAMVEHLLAVARERRVLRVSLETGTYDAFAPARALYASIGFRDCPPFADYTVNPHSQCMTLEL